MSGLHLTIDILGSLTLVTIAAVFAWWLTLETVQWVRERRQYRRERAALHFDLDRWSRDVGTGQ